MIRKINIRHFKCFERLEIDGCQRINLIVGDNGAGKTALLEAIFMALGNSNELINRFRQMRGVDQLQSFRGSIRKITNALTREYFHDQDMRTPITITLGGDGEEARSLRVTRGGPGIVSGKAREIKRLDPSKVHFDWTDSRGGKHQAVPTISAKEIVFTDTGEDLPDFFFFGAGHNFSSIENAERFSDMSRAKREGDFVKFFKQEYPWVQSLDVEVFAGIPAIYAAVDGLNDKLPITNISGGISRLMGLLLAIASRRRSVIIADELENGLYYKHHRAFWAAIIKFSRLYDAQLFMSTHSAEWIAALVEAAGEESKDIALWRIERDEAGRPEIRQFSGRTLRNAVTHGVETRGE